MVRPAYEIELVCSETEKDYLPALVATVTGLPKAEIMERLPPALRVPHGWSGTSFIEVSRLLGYNCNRRFMPFLARTPWPCILRCQQPGSTGWWALAYANGLVYDPDWPGSVLGLDEFVRTNPATRITSMLQVWVGPSVVLGR